MKNLSEQEPAKEFGNRELANVITGDAIAQLQEPAKIQELADLIEREIGVTERLLSVYANPGSVFAFGQKEGVSMFIFHTETLQREITDQLRAFLDLPVSKQETFVRGLKRVGHK